MRYEFITIEGCIGAGKTSLVEKLCAGTVAQAVLEQFENNPFLPGFYNDPARHAFPVELFFMAERYRHLRDIVNRDLFRQQVISDFMFQKSLLFALYNLGSDEAVLYRTLFDIINPNLPKPDLTVFLHTPTELLLQRIKIRGRDYEQGIKAEYLEGLQQAYMRYFMESEHQRIVVLEAAEADLLYNEKHYKAFLRLLDHDWPCKLNAGVRISDFF